MASPLTRGRGSKPLGAEGRHTGCASPLTRGRGSKPATVGATFAAVPVAPHAGARIETMICAHEPSIAMSPLTRGRGSKQRISEEPPQRRMSPLTRGRGSKHGHDCQQRHGPESPLTRGRGSKLSFMVPVIACLSRPSRGGADRNPYVRRGRLYHRPSPLTRGRGSKRREAAP